ncbi:purine or other phosphorylase 1 [Streptomyces sp. PVA_94-07]|uniref:phosphorylase family protein n=1 Tax=Streptomyces sp. PVA_94-07 TaxID=1225337 RepID=UPI0003C32FCB|nr:purine or other phosphorylase 1 [Streptomyces sp. PVA_94-07]ESQ07178.1 purine or other phosphorylase 1 [Streptomyces sp. PVA_94-07]
MVVLTALQVEYEAVRRHLENVREVELPQGTLLDVGRIPGLDWEVALAETGPTNTRAALITQPAIEHFDAEAVFFVGVAGALKDHIRLGDVVVASKIYGYHGGRESLDGFSARPGVWEPAHVIEQLVRSARREGNDPWAFLSPDTRPTPVPKVHVEPIASGDVLVGSRESETARRIRGHYNDAAAVDMESQGVAQAAAMHGTVRMLAIRGISDHADPGKASADAAGSQKTASRHAAAFAVRVLRDLRPARPSAPELIPAPPVVVVPGPNRASGGLAWDSQPVVEVEGQRYLVYEGPGDLFHETRDGDVVRRQAVARLVSDSGSPGTYVWLRQVEWPRSLRLPHPDPLAAFQREAKLCREVRGPDVVQLTGSSNTATLALAWPADPKLGRPLETLHELLPEAFAPVDPMRLWSIVKGLAEVAVALEWLSREGYSHRALRPTAVVMKRQWTVLRDLGLAAVPPRKGENLGPGQAPEQQYSSRFRPGPATDVYQLGALLHLALTGHYPAPGLPPCRPATQAVPVSLVHAVAGALQQDPRDRPGIQAFRAALLGALPELSSVQPPQR